MKKFIGRKQELRFLKETLESEGRSLVSIIGRRGTGKSRTNNEFKYRYINEEDHFLFEFDGNKNLKKEQQIENAVSELNFKCKTDYEPPKNWFLFFRLLKQEIDKINHKKVVIIIDEFAWLHNKNSGFVDEFSTFYNKLMQNNIMIIITGSAVSWMNKNVIKTSGGLHDKTHKTLRIKPFSLEETIDYLKEVNKNFTYQDVIDYYFFTGGVVRYLEKISPLNTKNENIKEIYKTNNNVNLNEFDELFFSIFEGKNKVHKKIVEQFKNGNNKTVNQLAKETGYSYNTVNQAIEELVVSDILSVRSSYGKEKKDKSYFLTDLFCYFYVKVFDTRHVDYSLLDNNIVKGFAFEILVGLNVDLFKKEIGRSGLETKEYAWRNKNAQIDLILDYGKETFTLIEAKYYNQPLLIDDKMTDNILNKRKAFLDSVDKSKKEMDVIIVSLIGTKNKSGRLIYRDISMKEIIEDRWS